MTEIPQDSPATASLLDEIASTPAKDREPLFERLFADQRDVLVRIIGARLDSRLKQRVDVADLVQETYLEALRRMDEFLRLRPMPFYLWLQRTGRQCVAAAYRRHISAKRRSLDKERTHLDHSSVLISQQLMDRSKSPSQKVQRQEELQLVMDAVASLEDSDRDILLLRIVDGLAHAEIACELGLTSDVVRQRFLRALTKLQRALRELNLTDFVS